MIVQVRCNLCQSISEVEMTENQYARLLRGVEHVQNILPNPQYTAGQRDLFILGWCEPCYDKEMPAEDEDDDDDDYESMLLSGGAPDLEGTFFPNRAPKSLISDDEIANSLLDVYMDEDASAQEDFNARKYEQDHEEGLINELTADDFPNCDHLDPWTGDPYHE